ncbi:DUF4339 domain-containing protein [Nevskia soli]|uniref:DUF4339 domain-containing protein n=1 Tax=Nevskia soli TaxID=418856 RepID=UPI000565EA81|nr:DUF4339 domain-containing protein [Nevskia soli]
MSDMIYLGRDGRQMGPFAWAQIAAMASAGQVRPDDLAWHDGMAGWLPAHQVLTRLGLSVSTEPMPPLFVAQAPVRRAAAKPAKPAVPKAAGGFGGKLARLLPGRSASRS